MSDFCLICVLCLWEVIDTTFRSRLVHYVAYVVRRNISSMIGRLCNQAKI